MGGLRCTLYLFFDVAFTTQRVFLTLYVLYSGVPETKLAGSKWCRKFILSVTKRQRAMYFKGSFSVWEYVERYLKL